MPGGYGLAATGHGGGGHAACPSPQVGGWGGVATPWVAIGKLDVTLLVLQFADHTNNNCSSSIGPGVWQGEVPTTLRQPKCPWAKSHLQTIEKLEMMSDVTSVVEPFNPQQNKHQKTYVRLRVVETMDQSYCTEEFLVLKDYFYSVLPPQVYDTNSTVVVAD